MSQRKRNCENTKFKSYGPVSEGSLLKFPRVATEVEAMVDGSCVKNATMRHGVDVENAGDILTTRGTSTLEMWKININGLLPHINIVQRQRKLRFKGGERGRHERIRRA